MNWLKSKLDKFRNKEKPKDQAQHKSHDDGTLREQAQKARELLISHEKSEIMQRGMTEQQIREALLHNPQFQDSASQQKIAGFNYEELLDRCAVINQVDKVAILIAMSNNASVSPTQLKNLKADLVELDAKYDDFAAIFDYSNISIKARFT